MPDPDDTLAEIDEAIDDYVTWYGGGDAATWTADQEQPAVEGHYGDIGLNYYPAQNPTTLPVVRDPESISTYNHGEDCRCGRPECGAGESAIRSVTRCPCLLCNPRGVRSRSSAPRLADLELRLADIELMTSQIDLEVTRIYGRGTTWSTSHDEAGRRDVMDIYLPQGGTLACSVREERVEAQMMTDFVITPVELRRGEEVWRWPPDCGSLQLALLDLNVFAPDLDASAEASIRAIDVPVTPMRYRQPDERLVQLCWLSEGRNDQDHRQRGPSLTVYFLDEVSSTPTPREIEMQERLFQIGNLDSGMARAAFEGIAQRVGFASNDLARTFQGIGQAAVRATEAIEEFREQREESVEQVSTSLSQPRRPGRQGQESTYGPPRRGRRR